MGETNFILYYILVSFYYPSSRLFVLLNMSKHIYSTTLIIDSYLLSKLDCIIMRSATEIFMFS